MDDLSPPKPGATRRILAVAVLLGRLLASFALTLAGAVLAIQVLLWAAPGDPVDLIPNGEEMREALEAEWGLSDPLWMRYLSFLGDALRGDFGHSLTFRPGSLVTELVLPAAGRSLTLLLPVVALTFAAGLGLALWSAGRRSWLRQAVRSVSVAPVFLLVFVLVTLLNGGAWRLMEAGLIERPGWFALPDVDSPMRFLLAVVAMALGSGALSEVQTACEDEIVRLRNAPFLDATIARGAPVWPHLLLNLVPPLTSVFTSRMAFFVGGLIIAEKVLQLNGAGSMLWQACRMRDYPVAMGIAVVAAVVVCATRLVGDLVRVAIDPRLREAGR